MSNRRKKRHIFLTGFMGSGKSTIGKKLAQSLGKKFIDSDDVIEKIQGKEIKDIFADKGEAWFRKCEEEAIERLTDISESCIISLGGGALISQNNLSLVLRNGYLTYIKSSPEEIWKRIRHSTRRPLLRHENDAWSRQDYIDRIEELLIQRDEGYQKADIIIERDGKEADEVVKILIEKIKSIK
jgi:shikimate kinase